VIFQTLLPVSFLLERQSKREVRKRKAAQQGKQPYSTLLQYSTYFDLLVRRVSGQAEQLVIVRRVHDDEQYHLEKEQHDRCGAAAVRTAARRT